MIPSVAIALLLICGQSVLGSTPTPRVRLVGGADNMEGRAEFFANGAWGSICDKSFTETGWPSVICLELGFGEAELARGVTVGERGNGPINFMGPNCNPEKADFFQECGKDKNPTCGHDRDIFIRCSAAPTVAPTLPTPETLVRLVGGADDMEGRAEFFSNGAWGGICDRAFQPTGWPSVICLELGYGEAEIARYVTENEMGQVPIRFQSPACNPDNADNFAECDQDDNPQCGHEDEVFIRCKAAPTVAPTLPTPETLVRLVGGRDAMEGRAEAFANGQWGDICDRTFSPTGWPAVVCLELGYGEVEIARYVTESEFGQGPIHYQSPKCNPDNADNFGECGQDTEPQCGHDESVFIRCKPRTRKDTCTPNGGECLDKCGKYLTGAKRMGHNYKCSDRSMRCCVPKENTCAYHGGECQTGSRCSGGLKSAKRLNMDGTFRCPPTSEGDRQKCCFRQSTDKEGECSQYDGECMTKDGGRCPTNYQSEKRGICHQKGTKCCVRKPSVVPEK